MKRQDNARCLAAMRPLCTAVCIAALLLAASHSALAAVIQAWVQGPVGGFDRARAITIDVNGNVVVTGYSGAQAGTPRDDDYFTVKFAGATGALLWQKRYDGPSQNRDRPSALACDMNGNVIVTGVSTGTGGNDDYYTAKYATLDGALLWERRYNGPKNSLDAAQAVVVDSDGNVAVTGYFYNGSSHDFYTAKYASENGAVVWEKRYNGPANSADYGLAVAVDFTGNVVVAGYSYNGENGDYYTAKYAAADGALVWERRHNGPGNAGDDVKAVAVDSGGNVIVTGDSVGVQGNHDYFTAKYAADDGKIVWEQLYAGPANLSDRARAVAIDRDDNVVVTGYSVNGPPSYDSDCYTAKYAGSNGALLWQKRYNGLGNTSDYAHAVAVDNSGNVVMTGYSTSPSKREYYTAKYASADGAVVWEKRHPASAIVDGEIGTPQSLALGPNGMVAITGISTYEYATVVYQETLPAVSIEIDLAGVHLKFTGAPLSTYKFERAPFASGPWSLIASPVASASGLVEYIDTNRPPGPAFYRTRTP